MSRGFVKEDDQEEPPMIPARAILPEGVENLVTEFGFELLKKERAELINARKETQTLSERERRREAAVIDGKILLLDQRINSARIVSPDEAADTVRFGCTVTYTEMDKSTPPVTFQIVGVDEANIKQGKVSFTAPIVKSMIGKRQGESFEFTLGNVAKVYVVESIH
ncbi:MAG: transcription elongation factor GreB [Salibacteraceae bacterium]